MKSFAAAFVVTRLRTSSGQIRFTGYLVRMTTVERKVCWLAPSLDLAGKNLRETAIHGRPSTSTSPFLPQLSCSSPPRKVMDR